MVSLDAKCILVIGGVYNGKYDYVRQFYLEQDIGLSLEKPVLYKLNHLVENLLKGGIDPIEHLKNIDNHMIVCDEMGCGVVPTDPFERQMRDCVGKICCEIAKRPTTAVVRLFCGLATVIK